MLQRLIDIDIESVCGIHKFGVFVALSDAIERDISVGVRVCASVRHTLLVCQNW